MAGISIQNSELSPQNHWTLFWSTLVITTIFPSLCIILWYRQNQCHWGAVVYKLMQESDSFNQSICGFALWRSPHVVSAESQKERVCEGDAFGEEEKEPTLFSVIVTCRDIRLILPASLPEDRSQLQNGGFSN